MSDRSCFLPVFTLHPVMSAYLAFERIIPGIPIVCGWKEPEKSADIIVTKSDRKNSLNPGWIVAISLSAACTLKTPPQSVLPGTIFTFSIAFSGQVFLASPAMEAPDRINPVNISLADCIAGISLPA